MKIKLLVLIVVFGTPLAFYSQTPTAFFYNKGKMTVKGTGDASTVLYINGDFIAGEDLSTTSDIVLDNSKTVLTGNFTHNATQSQLFKARGVAAADSTAFENSVFEFRGTALQKITTSGLAFATVPSKKTAYINFPTLLVNNGKSVTLDPALAAQAVNITLNKGWLVLKSERIGTEASPIKGEDTGREYYASTPSLPTLPNPDQRSALAHLKVTKNVIYGATTNFDNWATAASAEERGFIQVDMKLDPADSYKKDNARFGSIVGFGIPFQGMKSDYFTWNFLLEPNPNNYFGPNGNAIADRKRQMTPGKGYIVGIDLRGNDYKNYQWDDIENLTINKFNLRAKDGYSFNRSAFDTTINTNNAFGTDHTNPAFREEILNTNDVTFTLQKGFNYLANPYTSPLDISDLLGDNTQAGNVTPNDWNVLTGPTANVAARNIANRVWVLNGTSKGSGLYNMFPGSPEPGNRWLQVELNFYVALSGGGTYYDEDNLSTPSLVIPPLQMFVVFCQTPTTLRIPRAKQTMGTNRFIRSGSSIPQRYDDFIFEIIDKKSNTADRASIVLRPKQEVVDNPEYSNIVKTKVAADSRQGVKVSKYEDGLTQSVSSLLYTKDATNSFLSVNFVPYSKDVQSKVSLPLYLKPSILEQSVVIRGIRLETRREFETVILEDKLTGKKVNMVDDETRYETSIKPTDKEDRFILHFIRNVVGIEDELQEEASKTINSYYANGTLTVAGFDESDFGSSIAVYDIQGRAVKHAKVDDFTMNIIDSFSPGAYIVKVAGNNSYVAKFLVR